MKIALFAVWLIFTLPAFSQVSGRLIAADGSPVGFATVSLLKAADSVAVRSALSDEKGVFNLSGAPDGRYMLKVSSLGFQTCFSKPFVLQNSYDAGTIVLKAMSNALGEVVIRSNKPLVQQQTGGLVVNVQSSLLAKGSTVLEVLRRSPGVLIDPQNTNISLNGKSGVMVMLDGKLLRLSTAQVTAMLNGMTADDIDKIELLATPPARYDADGNAGLINIVTRKNKKAGTSGSLTVSGGYGKGEKASADLSLSHNSGKLSLRGGYSYDHDRSYGFLQAEGTENVPIIGGQTEFHYNGEGKPVNNYQGFSGGLDYRAGPNTVLGGGVYYSVNDNHNQSHNFGNYLLADSNLVFDSKLDGRSHTHYLHPSLYLEQTINHQQKLNVDLDYFDHHSDGQTQVKSNFADSLFAQRQRNLSETDIKVMVGKADYTNALSKGLQLESGVKGTYTRSRSTAGIENLIGGQWISTGAGTSNDLATKEAIAAAYLSLNWQADSLTRFSAGGRYEYSHNSTDHSLNAQYAVDRRLGKFFPNLLLSRKLNAADELQLSYSERISRPSFADLASYISYNDPVSVFTGNPALKPTITHNLKLAYNRQDYLFSLLYSSDTDPILGTQIMPGPTRGLVYLTPENADWQHNLTFQATIPVKAADWWEMNYGLLAGLHRYRLSFLPELLEKRYFSYSLNMTESFKLPRSYSIELSGYYNSSAYNGNSRGNGNAIFNLGFKKELAGQQGSFTLSVSDIFRGADYRGQAGLLVTDAFQTDVSTSYQAESHSFPIMKLSYFRSLGSNKPKSARKNSGTKEEQDRL